MIKRVGIFSSTRADYSYLKPVAKALQQLKIKVVFFITGLHLRQDRGNSIKYIQSDGFVFYTITNQLHTDEAINQAGINGDILKQLPMLLSEKKIQFLLLLGDRSEILTAALSAMHINVAIGHIHGGDLSYGGGIDDSIRHAVTKLAHVHFPASNDSARRLLRLQEAPWRIIKAGETSLENIKQSDNTFLQRFNLPQPYAVLLQHGEALQADKSVEQFKSVYTALCSFDLHKVVILPNDDPGAKKMIAFIKSQSKTSATTVFNTLATADFFDLLKNSKFLIGNSSSAIIEAPYLGVPAINLGIRQQGRKTYVSTLHGDFNTANIVELIAEVLTNRHKLKTRAVAKRLSNRPLASKIIAQHIKSLRLDKSFFQKVMS